MNADVALCNREARAAATNSRRAEKISRTQPEP
jgi:hypothetical protein